MKNKIEKRIEKISKYLKEKEKDAFVILTNESLNWENLYYTSGFRGTSGAVIIYKDSAELITDGRYITQAKEQSPLNIYQQKKTLIEEIKERLLTHNSLKVCCESAKTYHSDWEKLASFVNELTDGTEIIRETRRTKDNIEIEYIKQAGNIAGKALLDTLSIVKERMTEKEFEAYLNYRINMLGGESGFEMIVASGKRGALPHGRATDKPIEKGEIVTVDFSSRYKGYLCDITRNFSIGEPEDKAKQYHDILLETHITSAKKIKAGVKANEPHNTACEVLAKYDISKYFIHSLGHSFGLEIHEPPFISTSGNGQLKKNDIVTVEPGIYIPGWGGMRLEDDYLITQTGAERLTESIEQKLFIV